MWSEPSGSRTSAWRTRDPVPRRPLTRSRTQPEMFWPPSSRDAPSGRDGARRGSSATTRTGGATRGSTTRGVERAPRGPRARRRPAKPGASSPPALRRSMAQPSYRSAGRISPVEARHVAIGRRSSTARAVRRVHLQLRDQAQLVAVVGSGRRGDSSPCARDTSRRPARRRSRSRPGASSAGDVVRLVEEPMAVRRPAGREEGVARHGAAVDAHLVEAQRGDVEARAHDRPRQFELAAQERGRSLAVAPGIVGQRDRPPPPSRRAQESGLHAQRRRSRRSSRRRPGCARGRSAPRGCERPARRLDGDLVDRPRSPRRGDARARSRRRRRPRPRRPPARARRRRGDLPGAGARARGR